MNGNVPPAFRRVLARELPGWREDGVIDETASQALVRRYELDRLADAPRGWATSAFAILGAVAIGAGILSFVAANWAAIDSAARFAIVFGATIVAYAVAFALRARRRRELAEAAFVAAALGFGGSIALGAQQFNFSLDEWAIFALWAAGLVPLAFALRSVPVATVALAAAALTLPLRVFETSYRDEMSTLLLAHVAVFAVVAALASRRLGVLWFRELALAVVALGLMLAIVPWSFPSQTSVTAILAALTLAAGMARSKTLRAAGIVAAFLIATPSTYWDVYAGYSSELAQRGPLEPIAIALLAAAAAGTFLVHGRQVIPFLPAGIAVATVILLPHFGPVPPLTGVLVANLLVLVPAAMLIARGVALRNRAAFLCGTAVCAIDGFMRFSEYDHNLTAKALAFILVGIAFIVAAQLFERDGRVREPARAG